ncbi:hypothetical protein BH23PLA1_BH23PLA1_08400 [soil metagenome]
MRFPIPDSRFRILDLGSLFFKIGLFSVIAVFSLVKSAHAQEPPVIIENIRVGLQQDFRDQSFKTGTWTPVRVDLQAGAARFQGQMLVIVPDDDGTPTVVREPVDIPARTTLPFTAYVRPGSSTAEFRVEVYEEGRRRPRAVDVNNSVDWIDPGQLLLATLGNPSGIDLIPQIPEFRLENQVMETMVRVVRIQAPEGIPGRWYGYDAVEAVVLDTNDQNTMEALDTFRNLALKQWVRNGGHLVVAIGDRWQAVNDSFLAEMLPALPNGQSRTNDLGAIESFASSSKPITTPEGPSVAVTTLLPVEARGAKAIDLSAGSPVIVRGHYGLGLVTVVGLNVDQRPFVEWPDRAQFWLRVLDLQGAARGSTSTGSPGGGTFYDASVADLATYLHKSLEQFEGVRLVPFGWVAFFVFVYILLIGPGDYFFLKKVLKRMELTWITFPLIVLTVSLLAYATAYTVKGTDLRINRVDIVDIDQDFGAPDGTFLARGHSLATLFSPQNRDYDISFVPLPLDQPVDAEPAWRRPGQVETRGLEVITTWFGIAESRFGGMGAGSPNRMGLSSTRYTYEPIGQRDVGDPEMMAGVRVPIWTTKSLVGTWFDALPAVLTADLQEVGAERLAGTITNRLPRPLNNAIVVYNRQVYVVDRPIAPGETIAIDAFGNQNLNGYLERLNNDLPNISSWEWDRRTVDVSRARVVQALMFSKVGQARGLRPNWVLDDLDLSGHLALNRPIFVAEVDGPASSLVLDGTSADPKVHQTTVIRVLLPATRE